MPVVIGIIAGVVLGVCAGLVLWLGRAKKPVPVRRAEPAMALLSTQPSGERPQPKPKAQPTPSCARCGAKLEQRDGRWFCTREEQFI